MSLKKSSRTNEMKNSKITIIIESENEKKKQACSIKKKKDCLIGWVCQI